MFKKIGLSGAVVFAALSLMQTSAFAAERNDNQGRDQRGGFVQVDRNGHDRDDRDHRQRETLERRCAFQQHDDHDRAWR
ncbi:MAG: hypothetical protein LAP38_21240 [Acidobacteriia bacterium]|nr:hypothetical protein [Terriglobia bacterium]